MKELFFHVADEKIWKFEEVSPPKNSTPSNPKKATKFGLKSAFFSLNIEAVTRDLKEAARLKRALQKITRQVSRTNMPRDSCSCRGFRPLGEQCGRSQSADPPSFQKEARVIIGLISNHTDVIKIHLMIVFMDVTGDLRVMVEHSNCPFVLRNQGFHTEFADDKCNVNCCRRFTSF